MKSKDINLISEYLDENPVKLQKARRIFHMLKRIINGQQLTNIGLLEIMC